MRCIDFIYFIVVFIFSINFLKLKVYYGELNYEAIDEELAYPVRYK